MTNPSELPETKEEYIQFVDWAIQTVNEQVDSIPLDKRSDDFYIGIMGLSGGGSMATFAASRPHNPFNRVLVVNPAFIWGDFMFEFKIRTCLLDDHPSKCITDYMHPPTLPVVIEQEEVATNHSSFFRFPVVDMVQTLSQAQFSIMQLITNLSIGQILTYKFDWFMLAVNDMMVIAS